MKELSFKALLEMFDPSVHARLTEAFERESVDALVVFENQMLDSSELGKRSALTVGDGCTYKTVEDCEGQWLNDLPSQRQYPVAYCRKPKTIG